LTFATCYNDTVLLIALKQDTCTDKKNNLKHNSGLETVVNKRTFMDIIIMNIAVTRKRDRVHAK